MGAEQHIYWRAAAASALEWWRDAGVDTLVEDSPRDWLARPKPAPAAPAVAETPALADTLEAFLAWRLGPDAPEGDGPAIAPEGDPTSALMIVVACPDGDRLIAGDAGRLFDRMLAAIGQSRRSVYLASLTTVRPLAGRIAPEGEAVLAGLLRHHVALVAPKRLLLLGQAPVRALAGTDAARAGRSLLRVNLESATVDAVASLHPCVLLEQPAHKATAWRDLRLLMGGLR